MIRYQDQVIEPDDNRLFLIGREIDLNMGLATAGGVRRLESLSIDQPVKYLRHSRTQQCQARPGVCAWIEAERGVVAQLNRPDLRLGSYQIYDSPGNGGVRRSTFLGGSSRGLPKKSVTAEVARDSSPMRDRRTWQNSKRLPK
jgi:hypothetical protein